MSLVQRTRRRWPSASGSWDGGHGREHVCTDCCTKGLQGHGLDKTSVPVALEAGVRGQGASVPRLWASSGPADSCLLAVSPGGEVDGEPSFSLLIPTLIPS